MRRISQPNRVRNRPAIGVLLAGATVCGVLSFVAQIGEAAPSPETRQRPNVLLIVVDDMGYSDVGAYGGEIRTPNIDALARSGIIFTDFYVCVSCSPTRSMLMSGNDHHVAGLGTMSEVLAPNQVGKPGYEGYLNDRVVSVASLLRDAGYHTYLAGKWHLGEKPEHDPSKRGFEKSFTLLQGGTSHFDDEWMMYANYTPIYREDGVRVHVPAGFYSTEFYTDQIIGYVEQQQDDKPFFAYLACTAPHDPLHVPDEWLDKYQGAYDAGYDTVRKARLSRMESLGLIPRGTKPGPWLAMVPTWDKLRPEQQRKEARRMEIYAAMVENIDHHIGRLVSYLKKAGRYDNTLIIFFSDNGANGNEMHQYPETDAAWIERNSDNRFRNWGRKFSRIAQGPAWAQVSCTPFRLFKGFSAEGGVRSPLIVRGPGITGKRLNREAVGHVMDIAPTLLEFCGAQYPQTFQGRKVLPMRGESLVPVLTGQRDSVRDATDVICWEMFGWRAVRQGNWKATWISKPFGISDWQLFNLANDPGETQDVAGAESARLRQLVRAWDAYAEDVGVVMSEVDLFKAPE